jgi:hypothetical protein
MSHSNAARRLALPITIHDGPVPTASLAVGGVAVLKEFTGDGPSTCTRRIPVETGGTS